MAPDRRATLRRSPDPAEPALRLPPGLARGRRRPQARLHAVNEAQARERLDEFDAKWGHKYGSIATVWQRAWSEFVPFLAFPDSIREVVYTTNSIESLNARYRRAATACGYFPNEQAALKRIYLATLALDPSGRGRKRWNNKWKAALNEFDQLFDGRLTAGRVQAEQPNKKPLG